jgi:hypothetical protein
MQAAVGVFGLHINQTRTLHLVLFFDYLDRRSSVTLESLTRVILILFRALWRNMRVAAGTRPIGLAVI